MTASLRTPSKYMRGMTSIVDDGASERSYVKTKRETDDDAYLVTSPYTLFGEFTNLTVLQQMVVTIVLVA